MSSVGFTIGSSLLLLLISVPLTARFLASFIGSGVPLMPASAAVLIGSTITALLLDSHAFISLVDALSLRSVGSLELNKRIFACLGELLNISSLTAATVLILAAIVCLSIEAVTARSRAKDLLPAWALHSLLVFLLVGLSLQFVVGLLDDSFLGALALVKGV